MTKQNTAFVLKLLANILVLRLIFCDRSSRRGQLRQGRWAGRCEGDSGAGREHLHKGWWQWPQTAMSRGKSIGVRMGPGWFRRACRWVRISKVHGWAQTYVWHSSGDRQGHGLELSCSSCRRCGGPDQDSHWSFSHTGLTQGYAAAPSPTWPWTQATKSLGQGEGKCLQSKPNNGPVYFRVEWPDDNFVSWHQIQRVKLSHTSQLFLVICLLDCSPAFACLQPFATHHRRVISILTTLLTEISSVNWEFRNFPCCVCFL